MKFITTLSLLLLVFSASAQNGETHEVEPVGVYKEIHTENDLRVCQLLADSTFNGKDKLIDSIEQAPNSYTPPVLYFLSNTLFYLKRYNDAEYWFYVAQLRARYDVNRCADKTADASQYNMTFGPQINEYAIKDIITLEQIVKKVVAFVKANEEKYDPRWINLTGMGAMSAGLSGKTKDEALSLDKKQWPAIKSKTIDDYYQGFTEFLEGQKKK
jgi:hypothetical protein